MNYYINYLILMLIPFNCYPKTSITNVINVSAEIPADSVDSYGINVTLEKPSFYNLIWDGEKKTFKDIEMNYTLKSLAPKNKVNTFTYKIGIRDVFIECTNNKNITHAYRGIDSAGKEGFFPVRFYQSGKNIDIQKLTMQGDVISSALSNYVSYNSDIGMETVNSTGGINIKFPILDRELNDGGAFCNGGMSIIFYGAI